MSIASTVAQLAGAAQQTGSLSSPAIVLTWDTDTYDGIINYIGTNGETVSFSNPDTSGDVVASQSSIFSGLDAGNAFDHATDTGSGRAHTTDSYPSWWQVDFGVDVRIVVDHYGLQFQSSTGDNPIDHILMGSNDGTTWHGLYDKRGATNGSAAWVSEDVVDENQWRYLRIQMHGENSSGSFRGYLVVGEVEFWGQYIPEEPINGWITPPTGSLTGSRTFSTATNDGLIDLLGTRNGQYVFVNPDFALGVVTATNSTDIDQFRIGASGLTQTNNERDGSIHTTNVASSWWKIDFGDYRIDVDHYAIQGRSAGTFHLRNWKLQGSHDDTNWTDLDTQTSNTDISSGTWFDGSVASTEKWRYLRILQTGTNSDGSDYLTFGDIEFWGVLVAAPQPPTYAPTHSDWWADDLALSDGSHVSSWAAHTDGLSIGALTNPGSTWPSYTASDADLNSQPSVEFAANSGSYLVMSNGALTQPHSIVAIVNNGDAPPIGDDRTVISEGVTNMQIWMDDSRSDVYVIYAGSFIDSTTDAAGGAMLVAQFDGASSTFDVNADQFTGDSGSGNMGSGARVGEKDAGGGHFEGHIAYLAVIDGTLTAGELADVRTFASTHYGIFDPWGTIYPTPYDAIWADDPAWSNPGDGVAVSSWRNEGGVDPAQATGTNQPTFRASTTAFNGRATVEFDGNDWLYANIDNPSGSAYTMVAVVQATDGANATREVFASANTTWAGNGIGKNPSDEWYYDEATEVAGGSVDANSHILVASFNGSSGTLFVDGTEVASGNPGQNGIFHMVIGAEDDSGNSPMTGHIAYVGFYDNNTRDADIQTLESALANYYGITLS